MIDVARDREGVRLALEHLFEEDHARARIDRFVADAGPEQRERLEHTIPQRKLSPGYYRWSEHLLRLDAERAAGVGFSARELAGFEIQGLLDVDRERNAFRSRHPPCSACGTFQDGKFAIQCCNCGVKFQRPGA